MFNSKPYSHLLLLENYTPLLDLTAKVSMTALNIFDEMYGIRVSDQDSASLYGRILGLVHSSYCVFKNRDFFIDNALKIYIQSGNHEEEFDPTAAFMAALLGEVVRTDFLLQGDISMDDIDDPEHFEKHLKSISDEERNYYTKVTGMALSIFSTAEEDLDTSEEEDSEVYH